MRFIGVGAVCVSTQSGKRGFAVPIGGGEVNTPLPIGTDSFNSPDVRRQTSSRHTHAVSDAAVYAATYGCVATPSPGMESTTFWSSRVQAAH